MLTSQKNLDIFTSVRPKIGKTYKNPHLEEQAKYNLEKCRLSILDLSIKEAEENLLKARREFRQLFLSSQGKEPNTYLKMSNFAYNEEKRHILRLRQKHEQKIKNHIRKVSPDNETHNMEESHVMLKPEKRIKHRVLMRLKNKRHNKAIREKKKKNTAESLKDKIKQIKSSNQVVNFTTVEVPDAAYLYLSLGSTFVPYKKVNKHDLLYDTKQFINKLAWSAYFHENFPEAEVPTTTPTRSPNSTETHTPLIDLKEVRKKLKPPSRNSPPSTNKLFELVKQKLLTGTKNILEKKKKRSSQCLDLQ